MKKLILALAFSLSAVSFATQGGAKATEGKENLPLIHVADLEKSLTKPGSVFIYDANTDDTRAKEGIIPGAKTLASVTQYDTQATLPADKSASLVFYCANTGCMASHEAAKRALGAGYKNVSVMADGIEGWKKAGKKTEKFAKKS